jgi:uncharacterized protein YqeY
VTILEQIKADSLEARKKKDNIAANLLTTLYSEALMVGKNKGNRLPTDEEVISTIQKFLKNAMETKGLLEKADSATLALFTIDSEITVLTRYLPMPLSDDELASAIKTIIDDGNATVGAIMKALKEQYSGRYDGKKARELAKELL